MFGYAATPQIQFSQLGLVGVIMLFATVLVWQAIGVLVITSALLGVLVAQKVNGSIALLWSALTAIVVASWASKPLQEQVWLLRKLLVGTPEYRRREVLRFLLRTKILIFPLFLYFAFFGIYWATSIYILSDLNLDYSIRYAVHWLFISIALSCLLRGFRETYVESDDILSYLEEGGEFNCDGGSCSFAKLLPSVSNKRSTD